VVLKDYLNSERKSTDFCSIIGIFLKNPLASPGLMIKFLMAKIWEVENDSLG